MYAYGYAHDETAEQGEEKKVSNIVICIVIYKYSSLCIVVNMTIQLYVLQTI